MGKKTDKKEAMFPREEDNDVTGGTRWLLLVGIFLTSFSLLAFEITLTRLLSVLLLYHFVFAVVSLALLGLGLGGIFVHFFRPQIPGGYQRFGSLALFASLISLSIPFSVILMVQSGYIEAIRGNILFYCFLLFIPFFFTGVLLSEVFRMFPGISARIYGADMVGAAIGSLGIILVLDVLGGINTSFLLGVTASVAALLFALGAARQHIRRLILSIAGFLIVAVLLGSNLLGSYLPDIPVIGANPDKEIHHALYETSSPARIVETRWSAFGRTDLVEYENYPELMDIFIDGTGSTPMYQFNKSDFNDPAAPINSLKSDFSGYFPFFFLQEGEKDNALVIGPGGGRDILLALMGGVDQITAVEVNKDLVDIVNEYAWYNGGIYTDFENVTVVADEGRNFLKRQKEKYDLIMLSLPVTQTSRSLEGYSLTENFLFTTESINDYLEHLTDEGRLVVVTHDDFTAWRLLSISLVALDERGLGQTEVFNRIYTFGLSSADAYPLFVLKKTPFEPAQVLLRHEKMRQLGYEPTLSYFPYLTEEGTVNPTLMALGNGSMTFTEMEKTAKGMGLNMSPVTDNSPFFYRIDVGLPRPVSLVFWLSITLMLLVVLVPPVFRKWRSSRKEPRPKSRKGSYPNPLRYIVLFSMLGIGFMLIEISLIQKFILYLGQPVLSMAVLLFSLLVGAGIGSLYSGRLTSEKIIKGIAMASLSIAAVIVGYIFLLPLIFGQLLGLGITIRLLAVVIVFVPLGFLMGFPFPLGIRALKEMKMENYVPWMWGINGVGSVLGSVMTVVIAMSLGFTQSLLIGAGCYFIVFLAFRKPGLKKV